MPFDRSGFYHDVGRRVQLARNRAKMTQHDLAIAMGVSRATIASVELGRQRASLDLIWRASVVLETEVEKLVPQALRDQPTGRLLREPIAPFGGNASTDLSGLVATAHRK